MVLYARSVMGPEREADYSDYGLRKDFRKLLLDKSDVGCSDTEKADKIRKRANDLDFRFQHLLEDIELLHRARVLEVLNSQELKANLEEIEPAIEERMDYALLEHEMNNPDGVNVSSFGVALGHALSLVYPGDRTEQTRFWWGLALGYFGHPTREIPQPYVNSKDIPEHSVATGSDEPSARSSSVLSEIANIPNEPPQSVLSTVTRKFIEKEESELSLMPRARYRAGVTLERFGQILFEELADGEPIEDVTDFSLDIQAVIIATSWGRLTEKGLTNAYYRHFRDNEKAPEGDETTLVEEVYSVATDTAVESITNTHVDLELLEQIDELCRHQDSDRELIDVHKGRGVVASDVFELLWKAEEPQYSGDLNSEIQKGTNNVKWMLNEFADQGDSRSDKGWSHTPPVVETAEGFELNQYGELLGYLHFESEQPLTELYALAFKEDIQSAFDIDERLPALVDSLVESEVTTEGSP